MERARAPGGTRKDFRYSSPPVAPPSPKTRPLSKAAPRNAPRRPPARRSGPTLPVLPLVVGGVFLLVFVVILIAARIQSSGSAATGAPQGQSVANISCDNGEQLAVHYHTHVDIIYKGQPVTIPSQTGILSTCFYWMHTHDTSGIVHVEAPQSSATRQFTLGDFFKIWGQPLSSSRVATFKVGSGDQLKMWVNGQPYAGDPSNIVMKSHEQIVLEIGPSFEDPPPAFSWPSDLPQ